MKILYTTILSLFISGICFSQTAGLFFSEYAEGSSNNKYLEIYNGTGVSVDLGYFSISSCSNGCDTFNEFDYPNNIAFAAGTILADGEVFIVAHPSADSSILAVADTTFTYLSNGDDVFALTVAGATATTYTIVDIIGDMQGDPGSGWDVAGVSNGTKDHTLIRKSSICQGNPTELGSFGTDSLNSEWLVMAQDDWNALDTHSASCSSGSNCTANAGPDQEVCKGDTVMLSATGNSSLYYLWMNLSNPASMPVIAQQTSFVATATETYRLTVIDSSSNCMEMDTVIINVSDISVDAGPDQTICVGDTATLYASSTGGLFNWSYIYWISLGSATTTQMVSPTSTTSYDVYAMDTIGCKAFDTVKVIVNNPSMNSITQSGIDSVVVNGQTYTQTGTYTQTLTNAVGCDSVLTINITINTSSGLTDFDLLNVNVFPNPTSGLIKIQGIEKLGKLYEISIKNSEGRVLKTITNGLVEINISGLKSGIYFLSIKHENGEGTIRFIKR
mgnify:CR=1 FL=1